MNRVIVRAKSADEEFSYICNLLWNMQWFRENGYAVRFPRDTRFQEFVKGAPQNMQASVENGALDELKKIFVSEIYKESDYEADISRIKARLPLYDSCIEIFESWGANCSFHVFPEYSVAVTKYGVGGSFNYETGAISLLVDRKGVNPKDPVLTVVHEMVHLGIEGSLAKKYHLTHSERETLVDWICVVQLKELLPEYKVHEGFDQKLIDALGNKRMDEVERTLNEYKEGSRGMKEGEREKGN